MDKASIRSPQNSVSANSVARSARQSSGAEVAGSENKGGFSLLLADIADMTGTSLSPAMGAESLADTELEASDLTLQALTEGGFFTLTSLVGQTTRMDDAADAALRDGRAGDNDLRGAQRMGLKAAGVAVAQTPSNSWGDASAATDKGAAMDKSAALAAATEVGQIAAEPSTLSLTQPAKDIERGAQPQGLAALLAQMDAEPTPVAASAASIAGSGGLGVIAPGADSALASAAGADPAQQGAAEISASADAPQADAVLSLPDEALADQLSEQVAFWVQQKTQRAEMTIDRQGQPVQVQVAINGNEAHITFRSSEQQTRDMLDASIAQLREMLEQQGLSLAGVDVQTADAGRQGAASGGQERAGRPSAQSGDADGRQTVRVSADLRSRPDASRSVDLFV